MKKFTLRHEINCSKKRFWEVFFDKDFNTTLFLKELGFPSYEILEQSDNDGAVVRKVRGTPNTDMPKAVKKLMGDSFSYDEEGKFDPSSETWSFKTIPSTLAEKLRNEGTVRIEDKGDKVVRITELVCEAKVFGVGGLIESSTEKEMRAGWEKSAAYMNKWIADHPE